MPRLWFGIERKAYPGDEPNFFDTKDFAWVKTIEDNWLVIRDELMPLIEKHSDKFKPYFDDRLQFPPKNWKTIGFYFWGKRNHTVCELFPKTDAILNTIPNFIGASVNMLEPNSTILPHFGDTNAIIRCHLGLIIPGGLPDCGFRVKDETRSWEEGKVHMFLDAHEHSAFNNTNERRYILLFDIVRPEWENKKAYVCSSVLSMLSLYFLASKLPFLTKTPDFLRRIIQAPFFIIWWLYVPLQRRFNFDFIRANKF